MKKRALALAIVGGLVLTGCEAMLERSYGSTAVHVDKPTTAEDTSVLRVENYRELLSAVLYLVSQGEEEGTIQFHNYAGEVETDLTAACLEVAAEDPLGAYAVDYIKHEVNRVVSYDQAVVSIHYRRTAEQIRSIVNVTGTSAIRAELQEALAQFSSEVILRVAYFSEDEGSIARLIRQAYYDVPYAALGMPQADITIYPDTGSQRLVEILLTYPESEEQLREKSEELLARVANISAAYWGMEPRAAAARAGIELKLYTSYAPEGGATAYAALLGGSANAEGMALAYALVCQQAGLTGEVVEGTYQGEDWFWNAVQFADGERLYIDLAIGGVVFRTAEEFSADGYQWLDGPPVEKTEGEEQKT